MHLSKSTGLGQSGRSVWAADPDLTLPKRFSSSLARSLAHPFKKAQTLSRTAARSSHPSLSPAAAAGNSAAAGRRRPLHRRICRCGAPSSVSTFPSPQVDLGATADASLIARPNPFHPISSPPSPPRSAILDIGFEASRSAPASILCLASKTSRSFFCISVILGSH
ncbi:hypothetical protein VPH35_058706 [Triticum aestivum]